MKTELSKEEFKQLEFVDSTIIPFIICNSKTTIKIFDLDLGILGPSISDEEQTKFKLIFTKISKIKICEFVTKNGKTKPKRKEIKFIGDKNAGKIKFSFNSVIRNNNLTDNEIKVEITAKHCYIKI
jgi:hypothetical protein